MGASCVGRTSVRYFIATVSGSKYIDLEEQVLTDCRIDDEDAWHRVNNECALRGLELCSQEDYLEAYATILIPPLMYAYTSSTEECNPGRHVLLAGGRRYEEESDGCHSNLGCFPDRYYRCCESSGNGTIKKKVAPFEGVANERCSIRALFTHGRTCWGPIVLRSTTERLEMWMVGKIGKCGTLLFSRLSPVTWTRFTG